MAIQDGTVEVKVVALADHPELTGEVENVLSEFRSAPTHVVMDLSDVRFINSATIGSILAVRKQAHTSGRRLILCGINPDIMGVLTATRLDKVFEIAADAPGARGMLEAGGES